MKLKKLIKELNEYLEEFPTATVSFSLIPNDGTEDEGDENDLPLKFEGCLCTSELEDSNNLNLGLQLKKTKRPKKLPSVAGFNIVDIEETAEGLNVSLTKKEKEEVLSLMEKRFDASIGMNWDIIEDIILSVKK